MTVADSPHAAPHPPAPGSNPAGPGSNPAGPDAPRPGGRLPRRGRWIVGAAIVVVLVLVLALMATILREALTDDDGRVGDGRTDGQDRIVTGGRDGRETATFELQTSATAVTIRAADLDGDQLYRAETPEGGKHRPVVTVSGDRVQLQLVDSGVEGASTVDVTLDTAVTWRIRMVAGVNDETLDLSAGKVAGIEFVGGVAAIDLTLPKPVGKVPVVVSGGAGRWAVHAPAGVPVRFTAQSGAGSAVVDDVTRSGLSPGTTIEPPGWATATDGYELTAASGIASLTVDRR